MSLILLLLKETFNKERKEIGERVELTVPTYVFVTQFDSVSDIGV